MGRTPQTLREPDSVSQDGFFRVFVSFGVGLFCGVFYHFVFFEKASEPKILNCVTATKSAESCLETSRLL